MDTDDEFLTVELTEVGDERVVRATLDRPEKLNALPLATVEALTETVNGVTTDDAEAVLLCGRGGEFCAGMDLADMPDGDAVVEGGNVMHGVVEALRDCPVPVVAAVEGRAFGAGFMFCLGADLVVAAENATLGLQEINLGIPIAGYVTTILPRSIGEHRARDWLLTGREVSATEAQVAGLVARVVPTDDLADAVAETITQMTSSSAATIALLKDRMRDPAGPDSTGVATEDLAERELTDMRAAARDGDMEARLAEFRSDN